MMSYSKFFGSAKKAIGNCFEKALTGFEEISNPKVGPKLLKLQRPSLLLRVDGRTPHELRAKGGLDQRSLSIDHIRQSHIEAYQKFNQNPFAYGACSSWPYLSPFLSGNLLHTQIAWIHVFHAKSTHLGMLKMDIGLEPDSLDDENEHLIVAPVPIEQWLASTGPQYRRKFVVGGEVPNEMHTFDKTLPSTMSHSDFASDKAVLYWLMNHNCEDAFERFCKSVYADVSEEYLTSHLGTEMSELVIQIRNESSSFSL